MRYRRSGLGAFTAPGRIRTMAQRQPCHRRHSSLLRMINPEDWRRSRIREVKSAAASLSAAAGGRRRDDDGHTSHGLRIPGPLLQLCCCVGLLAHKA
jgi:hypothetical protein